MAKRATKTSFKQVFKRQGYTGKIYYFNIVATWITVSICIILTALSGILNITDLSVLNTIIQCAFAELGVFTGFFVWKTKSENCRKYKDVNNMPPFEEQM